MFIVFISILVIAISFLGTAGMVYGVCFAFGLTFSWKIAFGIWLLMALARSVFKGDSK